MVYNQRFVVSVLVNGEILKENPDGSVSIPFGAEYALKFRNKHRDRRAVVKLFIDGEEQSKGGYVIPPNDSKIIERNSYVARKFRFVAQDSTASQDMGKDQTNSEGFNGVVEARFYLEKEQPKVQEVHHHHHHHPRPVRNPRPWMPQPIYPYYDMKGGVGGSDAVSASDGVDYCQNTIQHLGTAQPASYQAQAQCNVDNSVESSTPRGQHTNCSRPVRKSIRRGPSGQSMASQAAAVPADALSPGVTVEGAHSSQSLLSGAVHLNTYPL